MGKSPSGRQTGGSRPITFRTTYDYSLQNPQERKHRKRQEPLRRYSRSQNQKDLAQVGCR
jgi:hypothetical protein